MNEQENFWCFADSPILSWQSCPFPLASLYGVSGSSLCSQGFTIARVSIFSSGRSWLTKKFFQAVALAWLAQGGKSNDTVPSSLSPSLLAPWPKYHARYQHLRLSARVRSSGSSSTLRRTVLNKEDITVFLNRLAGKPVAITNKGPVRRMKTKSLSAREHEYKRRMVIEPEHDPVVCISPDLVYKLTQRTVSFQEALHQATGLSVSRRLQKWIYMERDD